MTSALLELVQYGRDLRDFLFPLLPDEVKPEYTDRHVGTHDSEATKDGDTSLQQEERRTTP